ncbi:minor histocompatibility protein HB-1 [Gorilla gorilla gorilla]|uniref:minor histocompatibility protein HB-1 n=1 Tax=Gorilla gorilla gorilla TaxID=9595 RepID=UPI00300A76BB
MYESFNCHASTLEVGIVSSIFSHLIVEKPELEEQPECREEKRGSLHVWKWELVEVEDDVYLRHSSSLTYRL